MNTIEFEEILVARIDKMKMVLGSKAREYASVTDRLHNFKAAGRVLNISSADALMGMLSKHLVSVMDIIMAVNAGGVVPIGMLDEKIGDTINYFVLLEALLMECMSDNAERAGQL